MKNRVRGSLYLLLGTVIWGSAFVAQSVGMDYIEPFTFQAIRSALAAAALLPCIWLSDRRQKKPFLSGWRDKRLWKAGIFCGLPLFMAANLQQIGLVYTDAGKSAFLTAMYIVLVPILGLFLGRKISPMIPLSVTLAVAGLYLLSCAGVTRIGKGDCYLLGCAFMFAVQITCIDRFAPQVDALRLNCLQSLVCGAGSAVVVLFTERPSVQGVLDCWFPLCYAGVLSMGVAYSLQIMGQRNLEPTAASLIMSMESVFAVLFGWLILHETMTAAEASGCALVFAAVILSQIPVSKRRKAAG